jgi:hypothetical protein
MTRAEEYRRRAKQAEAQADETPDPSTKQCFLGAAREWRKLADQAEPHAGGGDKPRPAPPTNKMTREEAERLRGLLRGTRPADLNEPTVLLRIGRAIAQAIYRGSPKLGPRDTKRGRP